MTIAGLHTKKAAVKFINYYGVEIIKSRYPDYLRWPTKAIFLPRSWKDDDFLYALIAVGTMDNEPLQLQVSYLDRAMKARSIFMNMFKDEVEYKNASPEVKSAFGKRLEMTLCLPSQTAGSFRSLVSVSSQVWTLFLIILLNDYVKAEEVEKARVSGKRYKHRKGQPLQSGSCLNSFIGLPNSIIVDFLDRVSNGKMSLSAARADALAIKAYNRLVVAFEQFANVGIPQGHEKYITYREFANNHPKLAQTLEGSELKRFMIAGRTGVDDNAFQSAVSRVLVAANLAKGVATETKGPNSLRELLNTAAEAQLEEKVVIVNTTQSSILCINCKTEDFASYFKLTVKLKIGTLLSIFVIFQRLPHL